MESNGMEKHGEAWRSMEKHGGAWTSMDEHGGACFGDMVGLVVQLRACIATRNICTFEGM